jgi:DNA-directed RNA polymerase subunit RPC12/RpoP
MDEQTAQREGYSSTSTVTVGGNDDTYPGCPYCGSKEMVKCGCDKIGCAGGIRDHGNIAEYTCPWCKEETEVQHVDELDVSGGGF